MSTVKNKLLHYQYDGGVRTLINCEYNINTNYIAIRTGFQKHHAFKGKSKTNKECPQYLGITIAERVLSKIFKDVQVMPFGNKGYDVICNQGHLIDIKSGIRRTYINRNDSWMFGIRKNQIANYFLCLAFDNRDNLNPEHLWLIPSKIVNDKMGLTISETKLDKWSRFELTGELDKVIECCNIIKGVV